MQPIIAFMLLVLVSASVASIEEEDYTVPCAPYMKAQSTTMESDVYDQKIKECEEMQEGQKKIECFLDILVQGAEDTEYTPSEACWNLVKKLFKMPSSACIN